MRQPLGSVTWTGIILAVFAGIAGMYLALVPPRTPGETISENTASDAPETRRGGPKEPSSPARNEPRGPSEEDAQRSWRERRLAATLAWQQRSHEALVRFADERHLTSSDREALFDIEQHMFDEMDAGRAALEEGSRATGRERLIRAKIEANTAITALLGRQEANALALRLSAAALQ